MQKWWIGHAGVVQNTYVLGDQKTKWKLDRKNQKNGTALLQNKNSKWGIQFFLQGCPLIIDLSFHRQRYGTLINK